MAKAAKDKATSNADEEIVSRIHFVRGQKVMLDYDLAVLYEVETKALNQAVKRNIDRFPEDFMFRLTQNEWAFMRSHHVTASVQAVGSQIEESMRSQIATSSTQKIEDQEELVMRSQNVTASQSKRNTTVTPYAFAEHGVTMLASVLKSERTVKMSIAIVRAFIELKKTASHFKELAEQLNEIKLRLGQHDAQLNGIYEAIENLLDDKVEKKMWENRNRIGFKTSKN